MKISDLMADQAILAETGRRLARRRLDLQLTQAELAEQAGIAKRTLERIEAGGSAQMSSMIRVYRVLDLLPGLDAMLPEAQPSPMEQLQHKGKLRQRASGRRRSKSAEEDWHWGDET